MRLCQPHYRRAAGKHLTTSSTADATETAPGAAVAGGASPTNMTHTLRTMGFYVALCLCVTALPVTGQDSSPPDPAADLLAVADQAARDLDYAKALEGVSAAALSAAPPELAMLKQRQVLYERLLEMTSLLEFARENPTKLVGQGTTRGDTHLEGLIQLFELGIVEGAALGNRRQAFGFLSLQVGEEQLRKVAAREIAQVAVEWLPPPEDGWPAHWYIEKIRVVLHTGEVLEGQPTWYLPVSALSVGEPESEEDTDLSAFPMALKQVEPDDLVRELIIVGGPPTAPVPEAPEGSTEPEAPAEAPASPSPEPSSAPEPAAPSTESQ